MNAVDYLARAKALSDGATEGPWEHYWPEQCCVGPCLNPLLHDVPLRKTDAEFIAFARDFVPRAVAALEAIEHLVPRSNPELIKAGYCLSAIEILNAINDAFNEI